MASAGGGGEALPISPLRAGQAVVGWLVGVWHTLAVLPLFPAAAAAQLLYVCGLYAPLGRAGG